jgi:hypothetical protein
MGQIGQTLGGLFGIGQNPGLDTYGASPYGQNYGSLIAQQQAQLANVNQAQTNLASQLQNIAAGQGPNPAQAMLNQATGQNVANQAALAAGQRGAASNVGLIQRQAAQQGRQTQQQAAGQGAAMQAQQQLGALGQIGGVLGQQGNQAVGAIGGYEQAINAANQINAQTAQNAAQYGQGFGGGLLTGVGSMLAKGGEVKMQGGGDPSDPFSYGNSGDSTTPMPAAPASGSGSFIGNFVNSIGSSGKGKGKGAIRGLLSSLTKSSASQNPMAGAQSLGSGSMYNQNLTPWGNAAIASPGAAAGGAGWAGADVGAGAGAADVAGGGSGLGALLVAKGGKINMGSKLKQGGHVPGQAKVKGNSYDNDHVKALLSPGEIVLPRSVTQSKDPIGNSAKFVADVFRKKGKRA